MSPSTVDLTLGPILNGAFFAVFFFGVICMQTINYLKQFPDDIVPLKCIVVFLWLMQVAYTASICQGAYTMAVTDFGQIFALLYTPTALNVAVVVGSIVDHTVQAFFVTRIYKLTRALYISILLWILVALLQAASMTLAAEAIRTDSIPLMEFKWNWLITILFFGDAGLDIVISATLCFYLKKQSREAPKSTSLLVDRLVLYTIQTGLTTSLVALGAAAAFRIAPNEYIWTAFFIAMPGSFTSALLANLNNRKNLNPGSLVVSGNTSDRHGRVPGAMTYTRSIAFALSQDDGAMDLTYKSENTDASTQLA